MRKADGSVGGGIEEGREGADDGGAKGVLPSDRIVREDAPRALLIADSVRPGEGVHRFGKLDSIIHHALRERIGQGDSA